MADESRPARSRGLPESLRTAIERTLAATAGPAEVTRERTAELLDEVVRRGREAREELARRGQEAGAGIARRGQAAGADLARRGLEATGELTRRLDILERRLAALEQALRKQSDPERSALQGEGAAGKVDAGPSAKPSDPQPEG